MLKVLSGKDSNLTTSSGSKVLSAVIIVKAEHLGLQFQGLGISWATQIPQFNKVIFSRGGEVVSIFGELKSEEM